MNIQFYHRREYYYVKYDIEEFGSGIKKILKAKGGATYALKVPTLEQFNNFKITDPNDWDASISSIELELGLSLCSKHDSYNKKLGRKISVGRMTDVIFWARRHTENEVTLVPINNNKLPELILRKTDYGRIYFVGVK